MNLYTINAAYQEALNKAMEAAEQNEGVIPDNLDIELEQIGLKREEKIQASIGYYKNENAIADMLDAEIKALTTRKHAHESHAEWMKNYLSKNVSQGEKFEYAIGKISWRKSESVRIVDETAIPEEFIKIERSPKKKDIKDAIKKGFAVTGAEIEENQNIQIK